MESLWLIINFVGPALLLAVLVWAFLRNRKAGRANLEQAERGAREVREKIAEDDARRRTR